MAELQERYPDAFIHDAVDPRVTLCKVMAHSDCVGMDEHGHNRTEVDADMVSYLYHI
jgi:hypothetical protein